MESLQSNEFLLTERVGPLMRKYGVPCVISLLVGSLYNVVDQVYIGWGVGYLGNGATNVVFPLTVLALALATMIGDGACTCVSLSLGAGDVRTARRCVGNAVALSVLTGLVLAAAYGLALAPILRLFGATEANFPYAREYFAWIIPGIPFYVFTNTVNPLIRADGSPRFAMAATLAGAVANVILDAVAIFALGWGMMGAAAATVAGQVLSAGLSLGYLFKMKTVRLQPDSFRLRGALIARFVPLGFCSFLSQLSVVISMACTINMLGLYGAQSVYGADIPVTVVGIVCKYFQIVISVSVGMAAGCIPVVGYNIGAGRADRARSILTRLMTAEAALGAAALLLFQIFPAQLIGLFGSEDALYNQFAVRAFRVYLSGIALACVNKGAFIFLQSLGKAGLSAFLSLLREVILSVPLVFLLPRLFGLDGVLYSMPASDVLAFAASAAVLISAYRQLGRTPRPDLEAAAGR